MEAFFISALVVSVSEIGDKTQLLAILLAAHFRKPVPIILGIICATLANHAAAAWLGEWIGFHLTPQILRWILGTSFASMAIWAIKPDKMDGQPSHFAKYGAFVTTVITFFFAEIGDKTQIATVALAMKYQNLPVVIAGTTIGLLAADIPAVLLGHAAAHKIPLRLFRTVAAGIFTLLALLAFSSVGT